MRHFIILLALFALVAPGGGAPLAPATDPYGSGSTSGDDQTWRQSVKPTSDTVSVLPATRIIDPHWLFFFGET